MRQTTSDNMAELKAAAERLLAGTAVRSNGGLTLAALAKEAGLQRPYLYRTPYDGVVRDFEAAVAKLSRGQRESLKGREVETSGPSSAELKEELKSLRAELTRLRSENEELASQVAYLDAQNAELEERWASRATPIRRA